MNQPTNNYRQLIVWQKAHDLVLDIYKTSKSFPKEELFGITSQLRRAPVSVAANIVEGYKKKTKPSKLNHYNIAEASLLEVDYFVLLCCDLELITGTTAKDLHNNITEIEKMLGSYIKQIELYK